jgi:tetratricopeptide (TPR) repeat protein
LIRNRKWPVLVICLVALATAVLVRWHSDSVERSTPAILKDRKVFSLAERARQQHMALQRTPNDVALRWKLADTYQKLGAVEHAQEHLKYIAKLQPKQPEAPLALANTYLATQQWNKAEQIYRSLTRQVPRNSKGWEGLALTLYHQKKYFEAMEPARRSVRLHNIEPNHHFVLAHICLEYALQDASPASRHTYLKDAIKHFNSVLMTWPDHGDVYYYMGRAYSGPQ